MKDKINKIIKEKFGDDAKILKQIPTSNNQVYIVEKNDKEYMFKIYHSKNWPEDGKLIYINSILEELNIRYAKVIDYNRHYEAFDGGYVIEEKIKGIAAIDTLKTDELKDIYIKMARQIKKVHNITFDKFAFLHFGNPKYETFGEYIEEYITERVHNLEKLGYNFIENSHVFIPQLCNKLNEFKLNPVLCHGDLSIRNVIYNNGEVFFVDWDDAMALPAYADLARMTYDMMWLHKNDYKELKQCFLNEYFKDENIEDFSLFEKIYHIFSSLEFIDFSLTRIKNDEYIHDKINYLNKLIKEFKNN